MSADAKDARTDTDTGPAGVKKPVKTSKPYNSYLLRYQELKHMKESRHPKTQQNLQSNEQDNNTADETNAEMPQINEDLEDEKSPKSRGCKTKLCAIL